MSHTRFRAPSGMQATFVSAKGTIQKIVLDPLSEIETCTGKAITVRRVLSRKQFLEIEFLFGKAIGLDEQQLEELLDVLGIEDQLVKSVVLSLLVHDREFELISSYFGKLSSNGSPGCKECCRLSRM